jgi:uncharacterized protein DUF4012
VSRTTGEGDRSVVELDRRRVKVRERVVRYRQPGGLSTPGTGRRRHNRGPRRTAGLLIVVVALAVALDAAYVVHRLNTSLTAAAESLRSAALALGESDLDRTDAELSSALVAAGRAHAAMNHPAFILASSLPPLKEDARTINALSDAAELSVRAGVAAVRGARDAGADQGFSALYRGGAVRFDAIDRSAPAVNESARLLDQAHALVREPFAPTLSSIQASLELARLDIATATETASKAATLLEILPDFLGRDGRRQYLLAFQTPSEARGGGGLMGLYGILEARDGRVKLAKVYSITKLIGQGPARATDVPSWYLDLYGPLAAARQWQQANLSPNFPVTADVWLQMYEDLTGQRLDGAVAMDPIALAELTRATGPIEARGLDVEVGPENAASVLLYESYARFTTEERQNSYLKRLIGAFWKRLGGGDIDTLAFVSGLGTAVRGQHFKVFARPDHDQRALERLDAAGDYSDLDPNVQLIYNNNVAASKIDFFLKRRTQVNIELTRDKAAKITTTVLLTNEAPDNPAPLFNPSIKGFGRPGLNAMYIHFMLPKGASPPSFGTGFEIDGKRKQPLTGQEDGHPVVWDFVQVPPGESRKVSVTYRLRFNGDEFEFSLFPQATVNPDDYSVKVSAPPGRTVKDALTPGSVAQRRLTLSGILTEPKEIRVSIEG